MSRRVLDLFCGAGGAAIATRFWSHVDVRGPDECWEWTASRRATGYGQMNVGRVPEKAHRISFLIAYGRLPTLVMHLCDMFEERLTKAYDEGYADAEAHHAD